jgi:hypothetical protein
MATESILNTDILIRDRACVRFFGSKILMPDKRPGGGWAPMELIET